MTDPLAEIARLRALLEAHDIDPDPEPECEPEPEQFGPPTLLEHVTREALRAFARKALDWTAGDWERWTSDKQTPADSTLRIRLPKNFTVTRNSP
jgi:hypothetical protein